MAAPVFDDNVVVDAGATALLSLTFSKTNTGANLGLAVGVAARSTTAVVSSVTYNGVGGTSIGSARNTQALIDLWEFNAPASGANDVVITLSVASQMVGMACSATGVDPADALGTATVSNNGGVNAAALSVTDAAASVDKLYVAFLSKRDSTEAPTANAGQANDTNDVTTNATASNNVFGATSTEGGAASVTMGYTWATARNCAIAMAGFNAVAAGGGGTQPWYAYAQQ
jgi:hypothetical protein